MFPDRRVLRVAFIQIGAAFIQLGVPYLLFVCFETGAFHVYMFAYQDLFCIYIATGVTVAISFNTQGRHIRHIRHIHHIHQYAAIS